MQKVMTKKEFKTRWESNDDGGGISFNDIADCAQAWGLFAYPRVCNIMRVRYAVLRAANTNDFESFNPDNEDDE